MWGSSGERCSSWRPLSMVMTVDRPSSRSRCGSPGLIGSHNGWNDRDVMLCSTQPNLQLQDPLDHHDGSMEKGQARMEASSKLPPYPEDFFNINSTAKEAFKKPIPSINIKRRRRGLRRYIPTTHLPAACLFISSVLWSALQPCLFSFVFNLHQ